MEAGEGDALLSLPLAPPGKKKKRERGLGLRERGEKVGRQRKREKEEGGREERESWRERGERGEKEKEKRERVGIER